MKAIHLTDGLTESFFSVVLADLGCGRAGWSSTAPHLETDGGVCRLAKIGFTVVNGGVDNFLVFSCCRPSIEQKYLAALFAQAFLPTRLLGVLSVVEVHFARCSVVARVSKIRVQGIQGTASLSSSRFGRVWTSSLKHNLQITICSLLCAIRKHVSGTSVSHPSGSPLHDCFDAEQFVS